MTPSADAAPFIVICGPPGCAKTTDIIRAVGPYAVVAAAEGALKPIAPVLGNDMILAEHRVQTIEEATQALRTLTAALANGAAKKMPRVPRWFVADEFSYMADRTWANLEKRLNGFKLWGKMREVCIEFRDAARGAGVGVICNAWVQGPTTKSSGKFIRGGPLLPSDMPEKFPGIADWIFMAEYDASRTPWPWRYRTQGDANWALKCRDHNVPHYAPMNLGELLRHTGYAIDRPDALAWMEPVVVDVSAHLLATPPAGHSAVCESVYADLLTRGTDPRHAKWCVTDARDRALINAASNERWSSFGAAAAATATLTTL